MNNPSPLSIRAAVVGCLLCGCAATAGPSGGDPTDSADNADNGGTRDIGTADLEEALAGAYCGRLFGSQPCCTGDERLAMSRKLPGLVPEDAQSCHDLFVGNSSVSDDIRASVAAGRVRYDAVAAAQCVADIASTCDDMMDPTAAGSWFITAPSLPAYCQGVVIPLDGACESSLDCSASKLCRVTDPGSSQRTCAPALALGDVCATPLDCAIGLFCAADASNPPRKTCQAGREDGASCSFDVECRSARCLRSEAQLTGTCGTPAPLCHRR